MVTLFIGVFLVMTVVANGFFALLVFQMYREIVRIRLALMMQPVMPR